MKGMEGAAGGTGHGDARKCLAAGVAGLTGDAAVERRHEALMAWAEGDLALDREYAEQIYALAEEQDLEPVYALLLVHCGIGVLELEPPEADADELASQQAPPDWVGEEIVEFDDIALERRVRTTFRRFRTHLQEATSPEAAVERFLAEPDVAPLSLR
jgi:hypothetical protein